MEPTKNRFAHLLQPIRELTKNWDIDVAAELNDYLEELDEMCITFDGGISLNFAEAALLIQGSACIYSKKVELLHNLVYKTLESINDKNKKRNKQAAESQDGDEANGDDANDEAEFDTVEMNGKENNNKSAAKKTADVFPLPPECLIAPESYEKQQLPLISVKGEVLCSLMDFKMNLFVPGDQAMVILSSRSGTGVQNLDLDQNQGQERDGDVLAPPPDQAPVGGAEPDGDDHDAFVPLDDHDMEAEPDAEEHVQRQQAQSEGRVLRERPPVQAEKPTEAPPAVRFHDPYAVVGDEKPLKIGKCYKVPDGLDDGGKRKRKRASALQDFRSWFTGAFDPPEQKLRHGPTFTDLNYVFLSIVKEKLKSQKRIIRRAGGVVSDEELKTMLLQPERAEPLEDYRHGDALLGDDDSDNDQDDFPDVPVEFGGGDDVVDENMDGLSYEDLVKLRVEQLVVNSQGYTQETALSRRVKDWEDKIRPELELQEGRPMFDIHDYGDRIVGSLGSVGRRRTFASVVHGLDNVEACKYLLASLQLANDYTVEVDSALGLDHSVDSMGLTLLSLHRATDRFRKLDFGLDTA